MTETLLSCFMAVVLLASLVFLIPRTTELLVPESTLRQLPYVAVFALIIPGLFIFNARITNLAVLARGFLVIYCYVFLFFAFVFWLVAIPARRAHRLMRSYAERHRLSFAFRHKPRGWTNLRCAIRAPDGVALAIGMPYIDDSNRSTRGYSSTSVAFFPVRSDSTDGFAIALGGALVARSVKNEAADGVYHVDGRAFLVSRANEAWWQRVCHTVIAADRCFFDRVMAIQIRSGMLVLSRVGFPKVDADLDALFGAARVAERAITHL
jgi:hypothetical protein